MSANHLRPFFYLCTSSVRPVLYAAFSVSRQHILRCDTQNRVYMCCYSWKKSLLSRSARHCQKLATVQTYSNDHARNNPRRRQITWKRLSQSHVLTLHKNFVKSGRHHTTIITGHNWIYPETCARKWPHAQKNAVTGNMLASVVAPSLDLFLKKRSTV